MSMYKADSVHKDSMAVEQEVLMLGSIIDDIRGSSAAEEKNPVITLADDMWPPHFLSGTKCRIKHCGCEEIKRGHFAAARYRGRVRIVRLLSWKFADGKVALSFIPGPTDNRVITSSDVEILGEVLAVKQPESNKAYNPNKPGFLASIWNSITNYGTSGFWKGMYLLVDRFVVDTSTKSKKTKAEKKENIFQTWKKIEGWRQEVEAREKAEEAQKLLRKRRNKMGINGRGLEIVESEVDKDPNAGYDEVRKKLDNTSDAEVDSWWSPDERNTNSSQQ